MQESACRTVRLLGSPSQNVPAWWLWFLLSTRSQHSNPQPLFMMRGSALETEMKSVWLQVLQSQLGEGSSLVLKLGWITDIWVLKYGVISSLPTVLECRVRVPPFPHFLFPGRRQRAFLWGEKKKIRIAHKRKKKKKERNSKSWNQWDCPEKNLACYSITL